MVQLEEVLDETFREDEKRATADDDEDWNTDDSESVASSSSSLSSQPEDESLYERLAALRDIVPPGTRRSLSRTYGRCTAWTGASVNMAGRALWIVTSSVLFLGVPWALAFAEEQQLDMMESEMKAQERAGEMMTRGANDATTDGNRAGGSDAKAAL